MPHIATFRKTFKFDKTANLADVAVAVEAVYAAQSLASATLSEIEPAEPGDGFRMHSFLNLLSRAYEHAQGMLVALATGSPASAEALGRIVVEGSVNISCLALRGDAGTLVRFFRVWLGEHDRKLGEWKAKVGATDDGMNVPAMIDARREVLDGMETYLAAVESQCGIRVAASPDWPKSLSQRFQAIGRETDYYESYHRLSGASHLTGEDTLTRPFCVGRRNWLFADTVAVANATANLYSLLQTCKVGGIDGYCYLRALFAALPNAQTAEDYASLLPWNIDLSNV